MSKHYSPESLSAVAGGDTEFIAVIAQTFLEEIPTDLRAMEEAIAVNNKDLAYQFAHKMKPNLEMLGIDVVEDIKSIEAWTKASQPNSAIADTLEKVTNVLNLVFSELKADYSL